MATLLELTTPLTKAEIEQAIYDAIEARGVATSSWKPGAIARTIIAGTSIVLAAFSSLQAEIAEAGFLELSDGDWLTVVARQVYNVERDVGSFAAGNVTLDNTGGGVYVVAVGDLIVSKSVGGQSYRNTAPFSVAAFELGVIVPVSALVIGSDSSAAPAAIDTFVTPLLGVAVTNPLALVGRDPETDADLRLRSLAKTGTLSPNGPSDAYRFLALSAETDSGANAGVTRVTTTPDGEGNVSVLVASPSGPVLGSIGDTSTALGAVDEEIQTQAVPLAVTAIVTSAIAFVIPPTYEVWIRATVGLTQTEIQNRIDLALAEYLSEQPIGGSRKVPGSGFIFHDAFVSVIGGTVGDDNLIDVLLTVPAADVALGSTEAAVIGTVTATINLIAI